MRFNASFSLDLGVARAANIKEVCYKIKSKRFGNSFR